MLLLQILHQGSVGKAQLLHHDLTLPYICPSPLSASSSSRHRTQLCCSHLRLGLAGGSGRASPCVTGALGSCSESQRFLSSSLEPGLSWCHVDPTASLEPQPLLTCLLCPQGAQGQHQNIPRGSVNVPSCP